MVRVKIIRVQNLRVRFRVWGKVRLFRPELMSGVRD